jgi:hypothetical protein
MLCNTFGYTKNTAKFRNRMSVTQVNKNYRSGERNQATVKTKPTVEFDLRGLGKVMSAIIWLKERSGGELLWKARNFLYNSTSTNYSKKDCSTERLAY